MAFYGVSTLASEADGAKFFRLSKDIQQRIDACALVYMADKPEKIAAIKEYVDVSEFVAGRMYTIGAIKGSLRRGTARNWTEAVELVELEQTGESVRAHYATPLQREVARIEQMNGEDYTQIKKGCLPVHVGKGTDERLETKKTHLRDIARAHGKIKVEYEARVDAYTVEYDFMARNADTMARAIVVSWSNGTKAQKKTVARILESDASAADISSGYGSELVSLRNAIRHNLTNKVVTADIVELVRKYCA